MTPKTFKVLAVTYFLILSTTAPQSLADPSPSPADMAPMTSSQDAILKDPRTAAELPTKLKVPTDQAVEVKRKESDHQIQSRLAHIAESQEVFRKIKVSVTEGIVTLRGEVEEDSYAKSFSGLSERVQGVIGVVDAMTVTDTKKTGLRLAQSELDGLIHRFFKFLPYLASCLFIFFLTLLVCYGTYRFSSSVLKRKLTTRPLLVPHLAKLMSLPVLLLGIYLILQVGGAAGTAATLVGGTGVLGIIVGLAGKNILENLLASFMLTLRNPFKVGDEVAIGDQTGVISGFDSRCTMLLSYDGVFIQIPNSTVLGAVIKNLTAHTVNRVVFTMKVAAEIGFSEFKGYFDQALKLNEKVILKDPKPKLQLVQLNRKSAIVKIKFWVDTKNSDPDEVQSNVMHSLQHFMKADRSSLNEVESSIKSSEAEPTQKAVLDDRRSEIRLPKDASL